jgi:hypothetical protein
VKERQFARPAKPVRYGGFVCGNSHAGAGTLNVSFLRFCPESGLSGYANIPAIRRQQQVRRKLPYVHGLRMLSTGWYHARNFCRIVEERRIDRFALFSSAGHPRILC